jgi:hypothetical protein
LKDGAKVAYGQKFAVSRVKDPEVIWGEWQEAREPSAIICEKEDWVRGLYNLQLADVLPADQRNMYDSHGPGQRMRSLRGTFCRTNPLRATADYNWTAIRRNAPGGDSVRCFSDSRQDHFDAYTVGIEGNARTSLRPPSSRVHFPSTPSGTVKAVLIGFAACRFDYPGRKADAIEIRVRVGQSLQQIQTAVNDV